MTDTLQKAWQWASLHHDGQRYSTPDPEITLPYLSHIGAVVLELSQALREEPSKEAELSLCCAILHDILEDTAVGYTELETQFGERVAQGVQALSKNAALPDKKSQMQDSLQRILRQPRAVWKVKLADRIANMGTPPAHWNQKKQEAYREEARLILDTLQEASPYLARRLSEKIAAYGAA